MTQTKRLRALLQRAGVKGKDAAAELGIDKSTMSLKLAGKRPVRLEEAVSALSILNRPENLRKLGRRKPLSFEEVFGSRAAA